MTSGRKFFSFLSLAFFGLLVLSDPAPSLLFLALIAFLIGFVLIDRWLQARISRPSLDQPQHGGDDAAARIGSIRRGHRQTMARVTVVFLGSGIVMAYAMFVLKLGLGKDWLPFAREQTIMKGDPLRGYVLMDMPFLIAGFLFTTGVVWLPMFYFFEGMEARRKVDVILKESANHA